MRLFKIMLAKDVPFWSLGAIHLNSSNYISELLDADTIEFEDQLVIEKSVRLREVVLLTPADQLFKEPFSKLPVNHNVDPALNQYKVDVSDDTDTRFRDEIPELVSATVVEDDTEDDEPETTVEPKVISQHIQQAQILLEQNGNTVKKALRMLPYNQSAYTVLKTCLEIESGLSGRRRIGVIKLIKKLIDEYDE